MNKFEEALVIIKANLDSFIEGDTEIEYDLGVLNKAIQAIKILESNMGHVMPEVMDGYPSGNVYVGMTHEDYEELAELIGVKINWS